MNKLTTLQQIQKCLNSVKELIGKGLSTTADALAEVQSQIPTKTSDLINDIGFLTSSANTTYQLKKDGNNIKLIGSDKSETSVTDDNTVYVHPDSGVKSGTYKSVTVDAQGHVTGGTNPTTLSGYGITDAAKKTHEHTKADITDFPESMPASDVKEWAKADTKPSYSASEVGAVSKSGDTMSGTLTVPQLIDSGLTANTAVIVNGNKQLTSSTVSSTELGYVKGVTSSIQTQLDGKLAATGKAASATTADSATNATTANKVAKKLTFTGGSTDSYDGSAAVSIEIPTALPASDVPAWAKESKKPTYTASEVGATKVEKSSTNGNIKIDGTETVVYTHPSGTNPHGTTKSDVGLGNVPNVTTNNQAPTFTQATTRVNIASGETLTTILGKIMKWFSDLKSVAFTGSYNDLSDQPTIPTVNNATITINKNGSKVDSFTANQSSAKTINITVPTTVAELTDSGDYAKGSEIPTITDTYSGTSSNGMSGKAVKSAIDALDGTVSGTPGAGKTLTAFSQTDGKVSATFGNISITKSQVSDFPTIPTVNDATLTIQKNGKNVQTFTANASSNKTANIVVPRGNYFGTCATTAATKDKVVVVSSDQNFELEVGCVVGVKFTYSNTFSATADNPVTLNVNDTGAKNIYYNNTANTTGTSTKAFGYANRYNYYMYDGTYWVYISQNVDDNTTYSAMSTAELTTGTVTSSRVVRSDYLKAGIKTIASSSDIDTADNTVGFTQATTRANITTGEDHKTIFGKIAKWFADLKPVAFTGAYGDLSGIPTSLPANGGTSASCSGNATTATTASKVANKLTFTGGVTGDWDGSSTKTVSIPTTLPASDVSSWAKASTKPTYTPTEVGVIGTAPTSGQVAVFDGTTGKIKSTGYTIAKSVPSDAVFTDTNTDTKVTQTVTTTSGSYPLLLKNTTATATITDTARFGSGITANPSTNTITATSFVGNLTGNVTGNVSGSSGSCTGNAETATTASKVSNSLTFSGGVTGSYNGSSALTITTGAAATQAVANNLTTTGSGSVLDARQGKILSDKIAALQKQIDAINASLPYKITFDGTTMTVSDEDRN